MTRDELISRLCQLAGPDDQIMCLDEPYDYDGYSSEVEAKVAKVGTRVVVCGGLYFDELNAPPKPASTFVHPPMPPANSLSPAEINRAYARFHGLLDQTRRANNH